MCPEALATLAIDAITVPHPTEDLPIPLATMQEHYQTAVKAWLVAKRLGRTTMEQACKFLLGLVSDGEGGDSDPDYKQQGDFSTYFEDPHPANDRQRWLAGFYIYLNTPDCGRKRNKNRHQHATQMLKILEDLDPRGSDINILSRDEGYIVWTHWVDPKMEELSGGTIRSYLGTYEMFLNYVTMERVRPGQVPDLPGDVTLVLRTTIKKLKGWRRTVDLETRPQRNRKRLEDCDFRLTTDDVDPFRSSSVMVNASRLLERALSSATSPCPSCVSFET